MTRGPGSPVNLKTGYPSFGWGLSRFAPARGPLEPWNQAPVDRVPASGGPFHSTAVEDVPPGFGGSRGAILVVGRGWRCH